MNVDHDNGSLLNKMSEYKKIVKILETQNKKLKEMHDLLHKLTKTKPTKTRAMKLAEKDVIIKGPTDLIKKLYGESFFVKPKTSKDVEKQIKSKNYNFGLSSIDMALSRSKFLMRIGDGGRYSYIQKYPPNKKHD